MLINGSAIDDAPLDGEPAVFARLKTVLVDEAAYVDDRGRMLVWDITQTALLTLLDQIIGTYIPGGSGPTINTKIITDLLIAGDQVIFQRLRNIMVTESLTLLEAFVRSTIRGKFNGDTIVTLDFTPLTRIRNLTDTELVTVAESVIKQMNLTRQLTEVLVIIDQLIGQRIKTGIVSESLITYSDTGRLLKWTVSVTESIAVVDEIIKVITGSGGAVITKIATDAFLVTDGTLRQVFKTQTIIDALTTTDASNRSAQRLVTIGENIVVADSLLLRRMRTIVTTEGVTLIDLLFNSASSVRSISVSESVIVFDQALRSVERKRFSSDVLATNDATVKALQRLATLVEGISFNDGVLKIKMWDSRIGESITLSEDVSRQLLFAVLYEVRIVIGIGVAPVLGSRDPVRLGSRTPVVLGAYN